MGTTISMTCCSTEETIRPEEDDKTVSPTRYAYPDPHLDEVNFPRSASETTTLGVQTRQ